MASKEFKPGMYQILRETGRKYVTGDINEKVLGDSRDKWGPMILVYLLNKNPYGGVDLTILREIVGAKWKLKETIFKLSSQGAVEQFGPLLRITEEFKIMSGLFKETYCETADEFRRYTLGKTEPVHDDGKDEPIEEDQADKIIDENVKADG